MTRLAVVRVKVEAPVTSFRYPHFLVGRQVSYDMPPPSTIYGHIASAMGELPEPGSVEFGYDFRFVSRGSDLEHQHVITAGGNPFTVEGTKHRTSVQATVQPHMRDFLFRPQLTLYVTQRECAAAFRSPVYCVALGRSQDLATITEVQEMELEEREGAYLEHTLVPFGYRAYCIMGSTSLMPKYIGPPPERDVEFERYIVLHDRIFAGEYSDGEKLPPRARMLNQAGLRRWWVDPTSPATHGVQRGVLLHSCG